MNFVYFKSNTIIYIKELICFNKVVIICFGIKYPLKIEASPSSLISLVSIKNIIIADRPHADVVIHIVLAQEVKI